ncbi:MAG: hypothetical protein Q8Q23_00190 [bacterium]|nr:hypothetical protein [bacterium]
MSEQLLHAVEQPDKKLDAIKKINGALKDMGIYENFQFTRLKKIVENADGWEKSNLVEKVVEEEDNIITESYYLKNSNANRGPLIFAITYDPSLKMEAGYRSATKYTISTLDDNGRVSRHSEIAVDTKAGEGDINQRALVADEQHTYHANGGIKEIIKKEWDVGRGPFPFGNTEEETVALNKGKQFNRGVEHASQEDNRLRTYGNNGRQTKQEFDEDGGLIDTTKWQIKPDNKLELITDDDQDEPRDNGIT